MEMILLRNQNIIICKCRMDDGIMKNKLRQTNISFKEYWQNLKPYIKVLYILLWILFIAEMIYVIRCGVNWQSIISKFEECKYWEWNFDFGELYSLFFPTIYIIINLSLVKFKKINTVTICILLILQISYPDIIEITLLYILELVLNKTGWG